MTQQSPRVPIAILISGRGTNMVALVRAAQAGTLAADVRLVVSNKADAAGLERARELGVPTAVLSHKGYPDRESFDAALADLLQSHGVRVVALAGFMRVLTPTFLRRFPERVVNIHPALLPSFPGMHAQRQALEYGVKVAGCTVHLVDEGTDTGPILAQAVVEVRDDDDEDTLSARILEAENRLYAAALDDLLTGRIRVAGRRATRTDGVAPC
ncbi:MAG TPA: phosphoribosylglycinamide formyltransferase [Myxococcota bacterium]|nr:phosphoribosylglycinamide formyltransferase [Myxococcota bacterium]